MEADGHLLRPQRAARASVILITCVQLPVVPITCFQLPDVLMTCLRLLIGPEIAFRVAAVLLRRVVLSDLG